MLEDTHDDAPPTLPTGWPPPPELYPDDCVCIGADGSAWIQRGAEVIRIDPRWRVIVKPR